MGNSFCLNYSKKYRYKQYVVAAVFLSYFFYCRINYAQSKEIRNQIKLYKSQMDDLITPTYTNSTVNLKRNILNTWQGKILVQDTRLLSFFQKMAHYAKAAYHVKGYGIKAGLAFEDSTEEIQNRIVVYIKGERLYSELKDFGYLVSYGEMQTGLVNLNWYQDFERHKARLLNLIEQWKIRNKVGDAEGSITFTGHGVGGVYAMFLALAYKRDNPGYSITIVTFGAPRPGDQTFAFYIAKEIPEIYRITNYDDFAPHMPADKGLYRHPNMEFWISQIVDCNSCSDEWPIVFKCLPKGRKSFKLWFQYNEENSRCHASTLRSISIMKTFRHLGPYFGVMMT
ncbi:hypothetical protein G9A89_001221 [Geosiphon pyriformis]|nr:hypothetical protein G9A89_001221 [Geosiphon pyriformis]